MRLEAPQLARLIGAGIPAGPLPSAGGVTFHSGRVNAGDVFFALPGEQGHGIEHADDALARGAAFVVSDRPHPLALAVADPRTALLQLGAYARTQLRAPVVAISGSVGKTSTKTLAAAALAADASEGNLNTPYALAATLVGSWLQGGDRPLVLELGIDRPGEMDELLDLVRPSHALLTSIAESHLDGLGDLAGVAREKARLLERTPERFASVQAAGLLPARPAGLVPYGLSGEAGVTAEATADGAGGQRLDALGVSVLLPGQGEAAATNALGALALARHLGPDLRAAAMRMAAARAEPGRLQRKRAGERLILDDTYNSNPASAREALSVLRSCPGPHVAVLGDMLELGRFSARLHRELGAATRGLDRVVAIGGAAREIASGNPDATAVASFEEALPLLEALPERGTVLVKASRGMRLERVVSALEGMSG